MYLWRLIILFVYRGGDPFIYRLTDNQWCDSANRVLFTGKENYNER
jgi:hypothetical protein